MPERSWPGRQTFPPTITSSTESRLSMLSSGVLGQEHEIGVVPDLDGSDLAARRRPDRPGGVAVAASSAAVGVRAIESTSSFSSPKSEARSRYRPVGHVIAAGADPHARDGPPRGSPRRRTGRGARA
jgi:hypothetical protein